MAPSNTSPALAAASRLQTWLAEHGRTLLRVALYVYVLTVACPIRFWPIGGSVDDSWVFALNFGAAHGLAAGRDLVFTCGPLAYLVFPQDIGNNLAGGLLFQTGLWLALAAAFMSLFFSRTRFPLPNLALFSFCFGLSAPLYWFNFMGQENLMLAGALTLLIAYRRDGGRARQVAALILVGLLPLIKLSAGLAGAGALLGFVVDRWIVRRWKALPEAALVAAVPVAVMAAISLALFPSADAFGKWVRGSIEIVSGYTAAMSMEGERIDLVLALAAATLLGILLWLQARSDATMARFHILLAAIPLAMSFKHSFVRQDIHVVSYFGFMALVMGLVPLTIRLDRKTTRYLAGLLLAFIAIWQNYAIADPIAEHLAASTGQLSVSILWQGLRAVTSGQDLAVLPVPFPEEQTVEPAVRTIVGRSTVASLSVQYTNLAVAGMNLTIYPVVQRYSAYTPYLDGLNAAWIRDRGPRFLLFDGASIDYRDPWAESPATWLEVYRLYDTRFTGRRNLLLERRATPRFRRLQTIGRVTMAFPGELRLPAADGPVFWTLRCGTSMEGRLRKLFFQVPPVFLAAHDGGGAREPGRIVPAVLTAPVLGNYLPASLSQFAAVFQPYSVPGYVVERLTFTGPGTASYASPCEAEFLRPEK
jgi:hypothetical protein